MSQPTHTPGPVVVSGTTIQTESPPRFISVVGAPSDRGPEDLTNARLLAAAYNAFDSAAKKLGVNAVELAEAMQDGELLAEVLDSADLILYHTPHLDRPCFDRVRDLLAKVKGGAS